MNALDSNILSDPLNAAVFALSKRVYLVGGYLRDLVFQGIHSSDRDFLVEDDDELKRVVTLASDSLKGRVVEMRKEMILRVVLPGGRTLDFSTISGGDIYADLRGRDFTCNAMAWSPGDGLIDPLNGLIDIKYRMIRGIAKVNYEDDPLRMLRAYRFSAEKGWVIHEETRDIVKSLHGLIVNSSGERITSELFHLLNGAAPEKALSEALEDGLLEDIIPSSFKQLEMNIQLVSNIKKILNKLPDRNYFKEFSMGLTVAGLLELEALMLGALPDNARLVLSRAILDRLKKAINNYQSMNSHDFEDRGGTFDLFDRAGTAAEDILILAYRISHIEELELFSKIQRNGLLTSEEIMESTRVEDGPELGRIIYQVKRMEFEGKLESKEQALNWLNAYIG